MATNRRTPDSPAAPAAPFDPLFDQPGTAPAPRQPGDDPEAEAEARRTAPGATRANVGAPQATRALVPATEQNGVILGPVSGSTTLRTGPMGAEQEYSAESIAVAAQVKAEIAALVFQARQHPRSFDAARTAILADCARPLFAKAAIYRKPQGRRKNERTGQWEDVVVEGLSIRAAEAMLRHWRNVYSATTILFDSPEKRRVKIGVLDLESNEFLSREFVVLKTMEKKKLRPGQDAISQRINSAGEVVYVVEATEDELILKEGNYRSKFLRNDGLRLIPADIKEEALALCRKTRADKLAKDPDAEVKALVDAYAALRISPERLSEYLGCEPSEASVAQLAELQEYLTAIDDGDITWDEIMQARVTDLKGDDEEQPSGAVASLKERAKAKAAERRAAKP